MSVATGLPFNASDAPASEGTRLSMPELSSASKKNTRYWISSGSVVRVSFFFLHPIVSRLVASRIHRNILDLGMYIAASGAVTESNEGYDRAMAEDVRPALSESLKEAVLVKWHVRT